MVKYLPPVPYINLLRLLECSPSNRVTTSRFAARAKKKINAKLDLF